MPQRPRQKPDKKNPAARATRPKAKRAKPSGGHAKTGRPLRAKGDRARTNPDLLRVRWENLRPMFDFWGNEIKRYYSLETLQGSIERTLRSKDTFLKPSFQSILGPAPISSITIELFQEGRYQHIFRVSVANSRKKRAQFGLVVAKNHEEHSAVAKGEHANLRWFNERAPQHVVTPLRGGTFFLPDRHGRKSHGRTIYAYVTRWLNGYHELGIDRDLRMFINDVPRQRFSVADTERIKSLICETVFRSFEPKTGRAMELPQIASGDFVATRPGKGAVKIKLIACRRVRRRVTPARLIREVVEASWPWGQTTFHLVPSDPALIKTTLANALGAEEAQRWLNEYRKAVESGRFKESAQLPLSELRRS